MLRKITFLVLSFTLACSAGCGASHTPAKPDSTTTPKTKAKNDGGMNQPGDGGMDKPGDAGGAASTDNGPNGVVSSSAAGFGTSAGYKLHLTVGAPEPFGEGKSDSYSLRLGVQSPR